VAAPSAYDHDDLSLAAGYAYRGEPEERAARSLLFAGTILGLIGVANVIQGIGAIAGSDGYPANAVFPLARQAVWGWVVLAAGLAEVGVSFAIFTRSRFARTAGIVVGVANAFSQLFVIPAQPLWGIAALAADLLLVKVLVVHGASAPLS
jgi:hypothetical protein